MPDVTSPFTAFIKGSLWTIASLPTSEYHKKHADDSEGICIRSERLIEIDEENFSLATVLHEITHGFTTECFGHMLDLTGEQTEELVAEIVGNHCGEMLAMGEAAVAYYEGEHSRGNEKEG